MKKYLLSFVILSMTMIGFTACSGDDEPITDSLAKTTWVGKLVDDDMVMDVTISFSDDKNGVEYAKGTLVSDELPMSVNVEQYAKFTYTFDGSKGKAVATLITVKTPFGSKTYAPKDDEDYEEGDDVMEFIYNAEKNTLQIVEDGEVEAELTRADYKQIKF